MYIQLGYRDSVCATVYVLQCGNGLHILRKKKKNVHLAMTCCVHQGVVLSHVAAC